jgi:tRNA threonylcarbamoyladenosine dehydratase
MACINKRRRRSLAILLAFLVVRSTVSWILPPSQVVSVFRSGMMIHRRKRHRVQASSLLQETRSVEIAASSQDPDEEVTIGQTRQKNSINSEQWSLRFASVGRLYAGADSGTQARNSSSTEEDIAITKLREFTVVVVGLGGVGSWAAEALCRSGVGNLILIDLDDICISNTNRQLHATSSKVGQLKIHAMQRRLVDVNPDCNVSLIHDFVLSENVDAILDECCNIVAAARAGTTSPSATPPSISNMTTTQLLVLDCMDGAAEKAALIAACTDRHVPIVTCGGAAGKRDPTRIVCDDLARLAGDKLLASCRLVLRKVHHFPIGLDFEQRQKRKRPVKKWYISAIYSTEPEPLPASSASTVLQPTSNLRRCDGGALGTACFVTGSFGFLAAARCVDMITGALPLVAPQRRYTTAAAIATKKASKMQQ